MSYLRSQCEERIDVDLDGAVYAELERRCRPPPPPTELMCAGGTSFAGRSVQMSELCCPNDPEHGAPPPPPPPPPPKPQRDERLRCR